jgi:PA-IL-like protein
MIRRFALTVALAAFAGVYALAIERATFVLTDGERKSGPVVFHGDSHENLINGYLNLGTDSGKDLTFPMDQVAVIDFIGGRPPRAELEALPSDGAHVLVLRSGGSQRGRLINMIGGDTVRWQNEGGEVQQYAIRDVSRIYLNPQSARTVWNVGGNASVGTSGTALELGAVRVDANRPWTDTGITVKKGDRVAFRATGQIQWGAGQTAAPDGNDAARRPDYPVTAMPVGGLIGKVGNSAPFPIGSNSQPIVMPAAGNLMLGVNDNEWGDNSGFFSVVVSKS